MQAVIQTLTPAGTVDSALRALPAGAAGTQATLAAMHASIIAALPDASVQAAALEAAGATRAGSARDEVRRVQEWVQTRIRYVLDPEAVELLQSPALTLARGAGDCDDQTALLCALLTLLGHRSRMVAIGFAPARYAHVYAEAEVDGRWLAAETIRPWALGQEPAGVKATMRMVVNAPADALSGLFSKITKVIKKPIKAVGKVVSSAAKNPVATAVGVAAAAGGNPALLLTQAGGALAAEQQKQAAKEAASETAAAAVPAQPAAAAGAALPQGLLLPLAVGGGLVLALLLLGLRK